MKWIVGVFLAAILGAIVMTSPDQDPNEARFASLVRRINELEERIEKVSNSGIAERMEGGRFHFGLGDYLGDDIIHFEVTSGLPATASIEVQNGSNPKARLLGASGPDGSRWIMLADGDDPFPDNKRQAFFVANASNSSDSGTFIHLSVQDVNSAMVGRYEILGTGQHTWSAGGISVLQILADGSLLLVGVTSDPSSPTDGAMWYRSDTDKLRLRANGVTVDLN